MGEESSPSNHLRLNPKTLALCPSVLTGNADVPDSRSQGTIEGMTIASPWRADWGRAPYIWPGH